MDELKNWAGKRLGLPEQGIGSIAKNGRRLLALCLDWGLARLVAIAFFKGDDFATLLVFGLVQWLMVATIGAGFGHLVFGLRVRRLDGKYVGLWASAIRIGLILLVLPPTIWDSDNRGLHDKAAKTVLIRN